MIRTENASITHSGQRIEYAIARNTQRRKSIEITVSQQDGVIVRAPMRTKSADVEKFVRSRADWILSHLPDGAARPKERRFLPPETIPYLGNDIPVIAERGDGMSVAARLNESECVIAAPDGIDPDARAAAARAAVESCYRQAAASYLPEAVERWAGKVVKKSHTRVLVRNQKRRWGSCSSDGSIRLNWRLIMAEPPLIDYVAVHELAHLEAMNHSARFWRIVERAMPDCHQRRKRLNDLGATKYWL